MWVMSKAHLTMSYLKVTQGRVRTRRRWRYDNRIGVFSTMASDFRGTASPIKQLFFRSMQNTQEPPRVDLSNLKILLAVLWIRNRNQLRAHRLRLTQGAHELSWERLWLGNYLNIPAGMLQQRRPSGTIESCRWVLLSNKNFFRNLKKCLIHFSSNDN